MRSLASKPNVTIPGGNYPFGRIKDNPGDDSGTPVNEEVYGDFHQFFEKLMDDAGLSANGQPENSSSGFQLNNALDAIIASAIAPKVNKAGDTMSGDLNMANNQVKNLPGSSANGEAVRHEEIVAANASITTVSGNLATEVINRTNADSNLQNQIDTINANKYDDERDSPTNGSAITTITVPITNGKNVMITASLVSRWTTGAGSIADGSSIQIMAYFRNVGGTITQFGTTQTIVSVSSGANAPAISFSISGANILIRVQAGSGDGFRIKTHAEKSEV